jgi:hypothetical protein
MNSKQVATAPRTLARLAVLGARDGLSLGVMASSSPADFDLVLAAAGCAFAEGETLSEREVNDRLKAFLGGGGAMLGVDHVELRRWLVDTAVLARDGFGREYVRGSPRAAIAQAMADLSGHDLSDFVRDARARDAERRAARKREWQRKAQGAA